MQSLRQIPLYAPSWGEEEKKAVADVMAGDYLNEGQKDREFEKRFAEYVGAHYCILVPNGALALSLAIQTGNMAIDRIAIPDYYSIFAANALAGYAKDPFLFDVELETANIQLKGNAYQYFSILPVHVNGRIAKTDSATIEDCGQAPSHHTKGLTSCYSFHSTKLITCGGIGGAVCTDDKDLYERMSAVKDHGRPERALGKPVTDDHNYYGTNLKMSEINAAFGIEQLKKLPFKLVNMDEIYHSYMEHLGKAVTWFNTYPAWRVDCLVPNPQLLIDRLKLRGIGAQRFYKPTHLQRRFQADGENFPHTMHLYNHGVYLPSSPSLTDEDIAYVCQNVEQCLKLS